MTDSHRNSVRDDMVQLHSLLQDAHSKLWSSLSAIRQDTSEQERAMKSVAPKKGGASAGLPTVLDGLLRSYLNDIGQEVESTMRDARQMAEDARGFVESMQAVANTAVEMEKIAHHTQLVALNAAATAERAGSMGMAFGVITQQVTELPPHASSLSLEIREVIQRAELRLLAALDRIGEAAKQGDELAGTARDKIDEVRNELSDEAERMRAAISVVTQSRHEVEQRTSGALASLERFGRLREHLHDVVQGLPPDYNGYF